MEPLPHSTFLFADLAGFTALTEAHGDEHAADLASEFSREASVLLGDYDATQIKTIGDALMLRVAEPAAAVSLGCALTRELMAEHGYPTIRVGMHSGPAVEREGDWFGATVNIAARISGLAGGGEVLLSDVTHAAAGEVDGVRFSDRGVQQLRNVARPVRVFAAVPTERVLRSTVIDPVCRMAVDPQRSAGTLVYEGREYFFCSLECAARFASTPDVYHVPD
jgi:class 3 adenylate cyclase